MALFSGIAAGLTTATGLVSGIIGAAQARKARKAQEEFIKGQQGDLDQQKKENQVWYDTERNISTLDREENKAALSATSEAIKEANKVSDSRNAIMGGSAEAAIAQRGQNLQTMGNLARNIAATGTRYRQWVDSQNQANLAQTNSMQNNINAQKSGLLQGQYTNASQLIGNGINMFGQGATDTLSAFLPKNQPSTTIPTA